MLAPRGQGLHFRPCPRSQDIIGKRGLADQLGGCMHEDVDIVDHTVRSVLHDLLGISEERLALFDEATTLFGALPRSEGRRHGKECVSTCRYRWSPYP